MDSPAASRFVALAFLFAACADKAAGLDPVEVSRPSEDLYAAEPDATATPPDDTATPAPQDTREDTRVPVAPGATPAGQLWVVDDAGLVVGALVRRGSDDTTAGRTIYDLVTVFHPDSGLFFEVAMTEGRVLYPANTFFAGYGCDTPIGIGAGGCAECRAGFGLGFLHGGRWWEVRGGSSFDTMGPGSVIKGALSTECVPHGTSNAKLFRIDPVTGTSPPTSFTPPLRFEWR
jgi:hypothetical protein